MPEEFRKFLRSHERVPQFVDNLSRELGNLKHTIKRETVVKMVEDMSAFFVHLAQRKAEEQALSPISKMMLRDKESRFKELKEQAEALDNLGVDHVTQDKKGETVRQTVIIDDAPFI